jgi:hypothetical protein
MRGLHEPRLWVIMESALFMMGLSEHDTDDESIKAAVNEAVLRSVKPIMRRMANDLIASGHALNGALIKGAMLETPSYTSLSGLDDHHRHMWRQIVNVAHQIEDHHAS